MPLDILICLFKEFMRTISQDDSYVMYSGDYQTLQQVYEQLHRLQDLEK